MYVSATDRKTKFDESYIRDYINEEKRKMFEFDVRNKKEKK